MEENKNSDIVINSDSTASYFLAYESDLLGTVTGPFVFKTFLTPLETLAASKSYRDLLGSNSSEASDGDRYLAFSLSQLKYRIVKSPPFWKTESIYEGNIADVGIISLLLDKAISAELLYKESLKKKKEEALTKAAEAAKAIQESLKPKLEN